MSRTVVSLRNAAAFLTALVVLSLSAITAVTFFQGASAHAADANSFQAGNIVSDANFYNSNGMTAAQIQTS